MDDCIFCQIAAGKIPGNFVFQDEEFMVIRDIHPQAPVHLLVIPRKHVAEFIDADDGMIGRLTKLAAQIIRQEQISNYRLVNNGKGAAVIDHLHLHILGKVDKLRSL